VQFDLKYKYFDVMNYDIPSALFKLPELSPKGPRLYFPWTELPQPYDQREVGNTAELTEDYIDETLKFTIASGDRISISRIDIVPVEEHLRGCNLEEVIEVDAPIILMPKNEICEENLIGNYYEAVRNRIEKYFKIDNAIKLNNIKPDDSFAYRTLRKLQVLLKIHGLDGRKLVDRENLTVVLPIVQSEEMYDTTNIWFTINDAVTLGYLWAKFEDERNWAPFGESSAAQQSDAGRAASGDSRSKDAEEWKKVFAEIIKDKLERSGKTTKVKIIASVIEDDKKQWDLTRRWLNLPNAAMPGPDSLSKAFTKIKRDLDQSKGRASLPSVDIPSDST
jgi:hypothetical protein